MPQTWYEVEILQTSLELQLNLFKAFRIVLARLRNVQPLFCASRIFAIQLIQNASASTTTLGQFIAPLPRHLQT